MMEGIIRIDGKKLEKVAESIFRERYLEVLYNDFSPICAMVTVEKPKDDMMDMSDIRSLEYYGFKTTHIQYQSVGIVYYVYQDQTNQGHEFKEKKRN